MVDLTDLFEAKTTIFCEEDHCTIRKAWNAKHRWLSLPSLNSCGIASEAQIRNVSKTLYSALHRWQFRLLRILPSSSPEELLKCELLVANIIEGKKAGLQDSGNLVNYDAISYSWGRPEFTTNIHCNGLMVPTTKHLAEALYHFRLPLFDRYVWVDAFCINQYDDHEKSQQVNEKMFRIFEKAEKVLGWLGPSTISDHRLLNLLSLRSVDIFGVDRLQHHEDKCLKIIEECQNLANSFVSMNPWFSRLWIRQELTAASRIEMFCGVYQFDLFDLTTLISVPDQTSASKRQERVFTSLVPLSVTTLIADSMTKYVQVQEPDFHQSPPYTSPSKWFTFLLQSLDFNVTLGVDMFYAIRNLVEEAVPPHSRIIPAVDYTKSWHGLYIDFMFNAILSGHLRILEVFEDRTQQKAPGLHSWMTDLRSSHPRLIASSGNYPTEGKQPLAKMVDGNLVLKALDVGTVTGLIEEERPRLQKEFERRRGSWPIFCFGRWNQRFAPISVGHTCDYDVLRQWSEVSGVLPSLSYTLFRANLLLDQLRRSCIWSNLRQGNMVVIASKAVQPGDKVIRLFGSRSRFAHIVRAMPDCIDSAVKFLFLGVCLLWPEDEDNAAHDLQEEFELPNDPCEANFDRLEEIYLV